MNVSVHLQEPVRLAAGDTLRFEYDENNHLVAVYLRREWGDETEVEFTQDNDDEFDAWYNRVLRQRVDLGPYPAARMAWAYFKERFGG